jgi:TRAP-type C4-dicarboxylate transport system permease small subunit
VSGLERLDARIARAEKALIVVFLAAMILTAFAQILLRNVFGIGLSWAEPLVRYLVLWVGFIGAALAAREGRHITIEVFARRSPGQRGRFLAAAVHGCSAVVCGLLTYAGAKFIQDEAQLGGRTFLDLPVWVPELIIPVAFALMTARFLLWSIRAFSGRTPAAAPHHPS